MVRFTELSAGCPYLVETCHDIVELCGEEYCPADAGYMLYANSS